MHPVPLALILLRASRWFDRQLLETLEGAGWPRLTPAQSLVFAQIQKNGVPPASLARQLGTTRQGTHELVAGLVRLDLLAVVVDPTRAGGRLVTLTDRGSALTKDARQILHDLELQLGDERANDLRRLLANFAEPPA